jgi:hypothetical protein
MNPRIITLLTDDIVSLEGQIGRQAQIIAGLREDKEVLYGLNTALREKIALLEDDISRLRARNLRNYGA